MAAALLWPAATATAEIYTYDRSGRLVQVVYEGDPATIVRYRYDPNGSPTEVVTLSDDLFANGFEP